MSPTAPLPPDPNTTASIADAAKPISQSPARPPANPYPFYTNTLQRLPSNPNPNYPHLAPRPPYHPLPTDPTHKFMYPGRGFMARQGMRPPMFTFPYLDHPSQAGFARSPGHLLMMPNVMRGAPMAISQHQYHQLKGGPPVSVTENNGHKDLRDRIKDDNVIIVRDRKVRITENALCRSWLRNGCTEETQLHFPDFFQPLPRPLPEQAQESSEKDVENKEEEDQEEESVEHLSAEDLLQRHVKRAKRVRSRLREKRHQRITRYKTRLSLLLHPPMVEQQQLKRETSPQN